MKETIVSIDVSPRKDKKYRARVRNKKTKKERTIHFGHPGYQQYRDLTKLKKYKRKNHLDPQRRRNYFKRHSGVETKGKALEKEIRKSKGLYNAKILSHKYLW